MLCSIKDVQETAMLFWTRRPWIYQKLKESKESNLETPSRFLPREKPASAEYTVPISPNDSSFKITK